MMRKTLVLACALLVISGAASSAWAGSQRDAELLFQRGAIHLKNGEFPLAIADFERAQANGRSGADLFCSLGLAWWAKGDVDKAVEASSRAAAIDPSFVPAFDLRGLAHFSNGDFAEAAADFAKGNEMEQSAEGAVWSYLARTRSGGQPQVQPASPGASGDNWYALVLRYLKGGLSAPELLKAAQGQYPAKQAQLCEAHLFMGEKLLIEGEQAAAGDHFRQALDLCEKYTPDYLMARYESERQATGAAPLQKSGRGH